MVPVLVLRLAPLGIGGVPGLLGVRPMRMVVRMAVVGAIRVVVIVPVFLVPLLPSAHGFHCTRLCPLENAQ